MNEEQHDTQFYFDEERPAAIKPKTAAFHLLLLLTAFATITVAATLFPFGPLPLFPGEDP